MSPSNPLRLAALLLPVVATACATPTQRPGDAAAARGHYGDRWAVEALAIPAAWLRLDGDGGRGSREVGDGHGYGLRAAAGNRAQSIGLSWLGFDTDDLEAHVLGLDFDTRTPLGEGLERCFARAGAGIGAAWLDARNDPQLGSTLAAHLRLGLDFQPHPQVLVGVGFGGIAFGHPGETEAYGTFVTLGGVFEF